MGIKISNLPTNALPYSGSEKIPLVQSGDTKAGTLSSLVSYLSASLTTDSELAALSGNFAVKNANNNFITGQTINGAVSATQFNMTGGTAYIMRKFTNPTSFGINNANLTDVPLASFTITLGHDAGNNIGIASGGSASEIIAIGHEAGRDMGSDLTVNDVNNIVTIGNKAGYRIGVDQTSSDITDIVAIGNNTGSNAGEGGVISDLVALGNNAGKTVGYNGFGDNVVAIGYYAGVSVGSNGTSDNVVAIGYYAGESVGSNGTGDNVVAIGTEAGRGAGSGGSANGVVAIGTDAGVGAGSTGGNVIDLVAIGNSAGYNSGKSTVSQNNIFIGLSSGYGKQGSRNTFVGDLTNTSPTSATSLSGCIAIGYGATPTARNTIAIGSASTPLSVVPGTTIGSSLSGLKIMINGTYYTIPLLA